MSGLPPLPPCLRSRNRSVPSIQNQHQQSELNQFNYQNQNFYQNKSPSSNFSRLSINSPRTDYRFLNFNSHNSQPRASNQTNTLNISPSIK